MSVGSSDQILLYVWPKLWDLPSFDPYCLTAILYLQLALPGKFAIVECTDVDLSPSGQLPFLVHGQEVLTAFSSIVKYIFALGGTEHAKYPHAGTEKSLSTLEKSQKIAWISHVEANLGDLVASTFYSSENWDQIAHVALASILPVPQRYFVPQKLRATYQPRLDAAGLWSHVEPPPDTKTAFATLKAKQEKEKLDNNKPKFKKTFEKDKLIAKARTVLDIYARLLEHKTYVFHDKISAIDVAIASRILLLTKPPFPDNTLRTLVSESYPTLAAHSQRVYDRLVGPNNPTLTYQAFQSSFRPFTRFWKPTSFTKRSHIEELSEEDIHAGRMRWAFLGLALGTLVAYLGVVGAPLLRIALKQAEELERLQAMEQESDEEEDEDL